MASATRTELTPAPVVSRPGVSSYAETIAAMEGFTNSRNDHTPDQIWLLEHEPVYTQGTSCNDLPRNNPDAIPVIKTNRGGQMTYHGPGQLIVYLMLDLKRLGIGPKSLVSRIEQSLIAVLKDYGVRSERKPGAPGIYVEGDKIAALGLRIRNGCCFHGLSLNVDMDLDPFSYIDPCGYPGLGVTDLSACGVSVSVDDVADKMLTHLYTDLYQSVSAVA